VTVTSDYFQSNESNEHGSPVEIVKAARLVMGGIDLDPASSAVFNTVVQAKKIFTRKDNGLAQEWSGRVFLNPPGGIIDKDGRRVFVKTKKREGCSVTGACGLPPGHKHEGIESSARKWWFKLAEEYKQGRVLCGVFVGFTLEILQTTQVDVPEGLLLPLDPKVGLCFPRSRLKFLAVDDDGGLLPGDQPVHSNFIAYVGSETFDFSEVFKKFGACR
jgi:hypothetical protein